MSLYNYSNNKCSNCGCGDGYSCDNDYPKHEDISCSSTIREVILQIINAVKNTNILGFNVDIEITTKNGVVYPINISKLNINNVILKKSTLIVGDLAISLCDIVKINILSSDVLASTFPAELLDSLKNISKHHHHKCCDCDCDCDCDWDWEHKPHHKDMDCPKGIQDYIKDNINSIETVSYNGGVSQVKNINTIDNSTTVNVVEDAEIYKTTIPVLNTATLETGTTPVLDTATLETETTPVLDTATLETETIPALDTATLKTETIPVLDTATLETETAPVLNTATLKTETIPVLDTATLETETIPVLDTATLKTETTPVVNSITPANLKVVSNVTTEQDSFVSEITLDKTNVSAPLNATPTSVVSEITTIEDTVVTGVTSTKDTVIKSVNSTTGTAVTGFGESKTISGVISNINTLNNITPTSVNIPAFTSTGTGVLQVTIPARSIDGTHPTNDLVLNVKVGGENITFNGNTPRYVLPSATNVLGGSTTTPQIVNVTQQGTPTTDTFVKTVTSTTASVLNGITTTTSKGKLVDDVTNIEINNIDEPTNVEVVKDVTEKLEQINGVTLVDSIPVSDLFSSTTEDVLSSVTLETTTEDVLSSATLETTNKNVLSSATLETTTEDVLSSATLETTTKDVLSSATLETTTEDVLSSATLETTTKNVLSSATLETTTENVVNSVSIATSETPVINKINTTSQPVYAPSEEDINGQVFVACDGIMAVNNTNGDITIYSICDINAVQS